MERNIWKNFMILTIGGLIVLHVNFAQADDHSAPTESSTKEGCVLEAE